MWILGLKGLTLKSGSKGVCMVQESVVYFCTVKIGEILSFKFGKVNRDFEITVMPYFYYFNVYEKCVEPSPF